MPLPSPPTVNRLMSTPSRRTSIWCGSPIPIRYRYNCRFSTTLMRVLAVERKVIANRRAAARPERQRLARPIVLDQRRGNLERVDDRIDRRIADGEPADRRRPRTGSSPAARARPTGRWRRCRSPADRARRPAAAIGRRPRARAGRGSRSRTRSGSADEPGPVPDWAWRHSPRRARSRARQRRRRRWPSSGRGRPGGGISRVRSLRATFSHTSAASPTCVEIHLVEHQPGGFQPRVVAGDAVLIDDRAGRRRGWRNGRGRRCL